MSDPTARTLASGTTMGSVTLTVADLGRARDFYERVVGLSVLERTAAAAVPLGAPGGTPLVVLVGAPDAPPRPRRSTGLFHLAIVVPGRAELASAVARVTAAGWSFTGAADHLVSESLYLADPEGNGIEISRDRPRAEWPREGGAVRMDTLPLDVDAVLAVMPPGAGADGMPAEARMGHVHLQVRNLAEAEAFYRGVLGFEVTERGLPGALFVSAGGYHHHVGLNTWGTAGAPPPPAGARGLREVEILVPDFVELGRVAARVAGGVLPHEADDEALRLADPSGNPVVVRPAGAY